VSGGALRGVDFYTGPQKPYFRPFEHDFTNIWGVFRTLSRFQPHAASEEKKLKIKIIFPRLFLFSEVRNFSQLPSSTICLETAGLFTKKP
jgi:hypothetical protein